MVGFGLLQKSHLADGLTFLIKEPVLPVAANSVVFLAAPVLTFTIEYYSRRLVLCDLDVGMVYFAYFSLGIQ